MGIFKLILLFLFIGIAQAMERYLGWPSIEIYPVVILAMVIDIWVAVRLEDNVVYLPWTRSRDNE